MSSFVEEIISNTVKDQIKSSTGISFRLMMEQFTFHQLTSIREQLFKDFDLICKWASEKVGKDVKLYDISMLTYHYNIGVFIESPYVYASYRWEVGKEPEVGKLLENIQIALAEYEAKEAKKAAKESMRMTDIYEPDDFDDNADKQDVDVTSATSTDIVFDDDQQAAITAGCNVEKRLVAITGPAGTGKTRLIKEIYERLTKAGYTGQICAPTGKAAKRVSESTGYIAMTNHRMLGYGMPFEVENVDDETGEKTRIEVSTGPRYNRSNPFPYDFIIGDEYAMVNWTIHNELMAALKPGARVIVLGDVNQLKPIEGGFIRRDAKPEPSPFQTLLAKFDGMYLRTIHRQSEGSGIAKNCARIIDKLVPKATPDFEVKFTDAPLTVLKDYFFQCMDDGMDFTTVSCQIISPTNKGWTGVDKLNAMIQELVFDRRQPYVDLPRHPKRDYKTGKMQEFPAIRVQVGTKVVYTANTYDLNDENHSSVFNGEVGVIVEITPEDDLVIDFGDRILTIPQIIVTVKDDGRAVEQDPRKNINLAYCLTTHKMQGSECQAIIYVLNKSSSFVQSRSNFYTACSRARNHCIVITDQVSIRTSVMQDK